MSQLIRTVFHVIFRDHVLINILTFKQFSLYMYRFERKHMSKFYQLIVAFSFFAMTTPALCKGGVIITPTDLAPGAKYYLIFITGTGNTLTGQSSNIADYDAYVNSQASQNSDLSGITWKALGSTASVSARDHLNIGNFPIYRLDDVRIADNGTDLWDGSIATTGMTHQGGGILPNSFVWTGSNTDGTASTHYLGSATPVLGFTQYSDGNWINHRHDFPSSSAHRMLAVSQLLTVGGSGPAVPEPATITFWSLATSGLLLLRRRRLAVSID